MKLISLSIENFRALYGEHEVKFSFDSKCPVTVIIGENGAGKTMLLNALYWAFTGGFTKQFSNKNSSSLINKDALAEGIKKCSVEVLFVDGEEKYNVKRVHHEGYSGSKLSVARINSNGESSFINEALCQSYLEKFLPTALVGWFFFDGEAIDHLQLSGSSSFKKDVQKTFGFTALTTLIEQLSALEKDYVREEARFLNNRNLDDLISKLEELESSREKQQANIESLERKISEQDRIFESRSLELQGLEHSSKLEQRRDTAERMQRQFIGMRVAKERDRNSLLQQHCSPLVLAERLEQLATKFKVKELEQSLPHPFGTQLIDDIKRMGRCICGSVVLPGSELEHSLDAHREKGSTGKVNQRISLIRAAISKYDGIKLHHEKELAKVIQEISKFEANIDDQATILAQLDQQIKGIPVEKIQNLKQEQDAARSASNRHRQALGYERRELENCESAIRSIGVEKEKILSQETRSRASRRTRDKIVKLKSYVEQQFARQEQEVLDLLQSEISGSLYKFLTKHFVATVNPSTYAVETFDSDNREIVFSTGEGYVLKFAVIAAIVGIAAGRTQTSRVKWTSEPIIAPLVFDAPFSVNDYHYRNLIAKNLADMSGQLVLMFDGHKWDAGLQEALSPRIGKFYTLVSRAKGASKPIQKSMVLNGETLPLNDYGALRDESVIIERRL